MFTGVFSSSSKSKPYRNISRNKVSAIYAHYNNIKPLNNLFSAYAGSMGKGHKLFPPHAST
jgi:hypothetical protein